MKAEEVKIGELYEVFDGDEWSRVGHDIGNNSCFYHPAQVIRKYETAGQTFVDVIFQHDRRRSNGHFPLGFRPLQERLSDNLTAAPVPPPQEEG